MWSLYIINNIDNDILHTHSHETMVASEERTFDEAST